MTEGTYLIRRHLNQIEYRVGALLDLMKEIVTDMELAAYNEVEPAAELLTSLRVFEEAEPALYDYIEQLDEVLRLLRLLTGTENSYLSRLKGDWRRRYDYLLKHRVRLADLRHENLQCLACGAVYRAGRDHFSQLTPRYWACPNGCNGSNRKAPERKGG